MDPTLSKEETDHSVPPQLDGHDASVGDKRPLENGGDEDSEDRLSQRPRLGSGTGGDLKKVAEIVLALSTMAKIRGCKKPTDFEVELMAEARAKLVELCQGLAPKDIVARDAIDAVIEDLGLKLMDQRLGFRGPKLTIAERFSQTKKKMEESRKYSTQSSAYSSQPLQTSFNSAAENRGSSHATRMIPSDKPCHAQVSTGGLSASLPLGHVSSTPTSVQHQLPANEVRTSMLSSGLPSSHLGKDSALALPRVERAQVKLDGGPSSYALQGQVAVNPPSNHQVSATTWSLQPQSAKSIPEHNRLPNHTSARVDGTSEMSMPRVTPLAARDQNFRPFITQTAPGNLPSMHQPLHAMNYVQAAPLSTNHSEIAKVVQKLLQPKLPDHPTWIPPSRDYMNKALTCQSCQLTISEVDSVLICDACERGYHIKCAQSANQRGIPRGEWHCTRCLALSNGKPLPPKYGRVMRSNTQAKVPSTNTGVQLSSDKKVGTVDPKISQQTMIVNGSSGSETPFHTGGIGTDNIDSASNPESSSAREMNDLSLSNKNMDERHFAGSSSNILMNPLGAASSSPSVDSLNERSAHNVKNLESSTFKEGSLESKSVPLTNIADTVTNKFAHSQSSQNSRGNDREGPLNSAEVPSRNFEDNNSAVKDPDKSHLIENSSFTVRYDIKRDDQDGAQENTVGSSASSTGATEHSVHSLDGLHVVEWIGDVIQVIDEKTFYQACYVDGVTYKLQDHALFRSSNGKLIPSKLQSMWEDCKSGSKWVIVNRCYFPGDLPENVGRPSAPESNEVYESNHDGTVMAGLIQGPCEVLPPTKFKEESLRSQSEHEPNSARRPAFLCKWLYDEFKGVFQPVCG